MIAASPKTLAAAIVFALAWMVILGVAWILTHAKTIGVVIVGGVGYGSFIWWLFKP